MIKKRRRRMQETSTFQQAPAPSQPIALFSGYDGANWSEARGEMWWPTLDARYELDSFSREEILRRIHWLKANFGFIRGLIRNSADLIGWQTPQGQSDDEMWDDEAEAYFRDCCYEAAAFDVAGKFDFEDAQPMLMRESLTNGDMLTVLTKWKDGSPRVAFYATSQLRNPPNPGPSWRDGIQFTSTGRHMAYGVKDSSTGKVTVIPAGSCIYFGEFDTPGEDRPVPPLAHGVNHAHDITEVFAFTKQGIKSASLLGAVREKTAGATPRAKQGLTGAPRTVTDASGNRFKVADVWSGAQMPELDPGESIKLLHDDRPSQNVMDFVRTLIRDIAIGWGLPPEVVWEMLRMTGPGVRFVMDVADRWIKCRQKRHRIWVKRVWRYVIATGIQNGDLRLPAVSPKTGREKWWAVSCTSQRNLTIDRGQVSRAKLEELSAGVSTLSDWEEMDGRDWKDRGKQRIREVAWLKAECEEAGLTYAEVFPPRQGAAAPVVSDDEPPTKGKPAENDTDEDEE
jgi:capsid protein